MMVSALSWTLPPGDTNDGVPDPVLRSALFGAVVREVCLGGLAGLDGHFLGLGAVLLVPALHRVLAGGHVLDLEGAVLGDRLETALGHAGVPAHPGMNVALPLDHALLLGDV